MYDWLTELQCYEILQVSRDSSFEDIRRAYIDLAWQCQKQLLEGNEESKKQAEDFLKSINLAYERLKSKFQGLNFTDGYKNQQNIEVRKTNPEFWYQKGVLQVNLREEEEAIRSFSQAIKLDSWYLEARFYRAHLLAKKGFVYRAEADFRVIDELMQKKSEPVNADFWGKDRVYVRPKRKEIFKGEIRVIGLKLRRFRQKIGLNSSIKYSVFTYKYRSLFYSI